MKRIPSAQRGSCPLSFVVVVLFLLSFMSTVISEEIEASIVPPIIDIAPLLHPSDHTIEQIDFTSRQLAQASEQWGFYHVVNHGIDESLLTELEEQMERFFSLPLESKISVKRQENNSRGYANDELTKRTLDLKEVYDFGPDITTLLPLYSEKARENAVIDGINQWIDPTLAPDFRNVVDRYFDASYRLSFALMKATARYLTCFEDPLFFDDKFDLHSSLFRLNYYPIVDKNAETNSGSDRVANGDNEGLGISRHTDAGALTILWQDPRHSSLEVYSGSKQDFADGDWVPVVPVPGALTVNNGDMLQVWTNDRFKAAEHRVRATRNTASSPRLSAAFFLNPNYDTLVAPHKCGGKQSGKVDAEEENLHYSPIRWGDFRMLRFKGDYADYGEEVQIEHYRISTEKVAAVVASETLGDNEL